MDKSNQPWVNVLAPTSQSDIDVNVSDDFMQKFCALYSSNFNAKCLRDFQFSWHAYSGQPFEKKLIQFKSDYKLNKIFIEREGGPQHISVIINGIKQQWKRQD